MADQKKLKQLTAQRQTEIIKLQEIRKIADQALIDKSLHVNFECRFRTCDKIYELFKSLHSSILSIVATQDNGDLEAQNTILTEFDNDYFHILAVHWQLRPDESSNQTVPNTTITRQNNVKLPELDIPSFSGDFTTWPTFRDCFEALIHDNDELSNVEKFNYLLSFLKGEARSLLKGTPVTSQNYIVAYNKLKGRYDDNILIARMHWHAIESLKPLPSSGNANALRILIDTFTENVDILNNMGYPVAQWDFILFNMLFDRLDSATATRFELNHDLKPTNTDTFQTLLKFLEKQCVAAKKVSMSTSSTSKSLDTHKIKSSPDSNIRSNQKTNFKSTFLVNSESHSTMNCQICHQNHLIYNCPEFIAKSPQERYTLVKNKHWCTNCLGSKHFVANCTSRSVCRKCTKKHHTLLHFELHNKILDNSKQIHENNSEPSTSRADNSVLEKKSYLVSDSNTVLLSTAIIDVLDSFGTYQKTRVILDSGSQTNFITNKCAIKLGLTRSKTNVCISGIGEISSRTTQEVSCKIKSRLKSQFVLDIDCLVIPKICSSMPCTDIPDSEFCNFSHLLLADPHFNVSAPVDMLLGADIFGSLLTGNRFSISPHQPVALETMFGWIVMGKISYSPASQIQSVLTSSYFLNNLSLENLVTKFWELENIPHRGSNLSSDEQIAESIFDKTVARLENGRYEVSLPFKELDFSFENSRDVALRRFLSLERRLMSNPCLYEQYKDFMNDYLNSGHMKLLSDLSLSPKCYYIPHHCVIKPDSSTTKLRVVFDASCRTPLSNQSLNDVTLPGPKLQPDIISILIRFRLHNVVFTCDIKQMYRQISVAVEHRDFQRILWRFSKLDSVQDYQLQTVTYGLRSSPYLAIRTLQKHANDYRHTHPNASRIVLNDMFVDDVVSGCSSVTEALDIQKELIDLLGGACFELRKWTSNDNQVLQQLPSSAIQFDSISFDADSIYTVKILGLKWNPSLDFFSYDITTLENSCTKRSMLSDLARIYDPLGLLTPLTLRLKVLIQHLWTLGIEWDAIPPPEIVNTWTNFKADLGSLSQLRIPRQILPHNYVTAEIHGFCDASEHGYAASAYLRVLTSDNQITANLLIAKSKVAPLKRISIPRLELSGALLLANLLSYVENVLLTNVKISQIIAWTDSTIVLSWICSSPHKWSTFVSNRITQIQEKISPSCWHHISSADNPADAASRGLDPSEIVSNSLWWNGPTWLTCPSHMWPRNSSNSCHSEPVEERKLMSFPTQIQNNAITSLIDNTSSFSKLQRILAYVIRFIYILKNSLSRKTDVLSHSELEYSLLKLIKHVQNLEFSNEIDRLSRNKPLPKIFRKLTPFLDEAGLLRVGGRLVHSQLSFEPKHPILLPGSHRLTHLIIKHTHEIYLHPGMQTLQYLLNQRYWILSPRRSIRKVISQCMKCFRTNPASFQPRMGDLPPSRISQVKPFSHVGIDFAGPFTTTMGKVRGAKTYKSYICIFVCMSTKCIHLELVSSLEKDPFVAAFRRFVSRRGRVNRVYSDCGTNFIAAAKQLQCTFKDSFEGEKLEWHFNPPSAPNFGGLWEAGVKSVKAHLKRVIGSQSLTYEEFYTLLVQIEAVLNSRPLCALSNDPNDYGCLTPGHFLTLAPLNSPHEPDHSNTKLNSLTRWQLLQKMHQDFWSKWHKEYLHTLMQRHKWTNDSISIKPNILVLLKDESLPPIKWHLGRVEVIHPGPDGIVRVVSVRTAKGILKRPVSKICPLPIDA